jgi:hypothetical protein
MLLAGIVLAAWLLRWDANRGRPGGPRVRRSDR